MAMNKTAVAKNTDEYIQQFPANVQKMLQQLRKTIKAAAPKAEELISYQMPAFKLHGMLVYFAGYKNHIGFYPTGSPIVAFKKEVSAFKNSKGAVQFPLDKPLPLDLVTRMVQFKLKENIEKAGIKNTVKPVAKAVVKKAATPKQSDEEQVKIYLAQLPAAARADIETVREIILSASKKLKERIKWNAPSYYYKEDIVTFGPYKTHKLLLVFHHPAIVKINSPLLEGNYKDRRLIHFKDKEAALKNRKELTRIIKAHIALIDKN
ncbi:DUF1801 domain-containing protein [Ferruginibacter sp.]